MNMPQYQIHVKEQALILSKETLHSVFIGNYYSARGN